MSYKLKIRSLLALRMRIKTIFPLNLRVLSQTEIKAIVKKLVMSIMMTTKIKLYVDITQLANVSTEGYGSDCRYSHPKMCRKYIKCGYNNIYGCTRGANCKFFHPKLCHNSVDFFKFDKVYCNYYHLVGTLRPNSGNTVNNNDQFIDS